MIKKIILSALGAMCAIISFAQSELFTIKGKVIDAKDGQSVPFASVRLLSADEKDEIKGETTGEDGKFVINGIENGTYMLEISFLGYADFKTKITPDILSKPGGTKMTVRMREDVALLSQVEVVGTRTQLQMEVDKKTFIVNESAMTAGVSATDVLRDIPTVDVDIEGNVSLRNNENVEVFVNGKSMGLSAENQGDLLEQFPAGSIEKIEVITNPSSKFAAEGTAGIINIVLKKTNKPGVYATVSGGVSYPWLGKLGGNLSGGVTITSGRWTAIASLGFQRKTFHGKTKIRRDNYRGNDTTFTHTDGENDMTSTSLFANVSADCKISEKDRMGIGGIVSLGQNERNEALDYNYGDKMGETYYRTSSSRRTSSGTSPRNAFRVKYDYEHDFSNGDDLLFQGNYSRNIFDQTRNYEQVYFNSFEQEIEDRATEQIQNTGRTRENGNLSLDYTKNINSLCQLELGLGADIQRERNDAVYQIKYADADDFVTQDALSSDFTYHQRLYSFYGMWSQKHKRFSYKLGLRGELTDVAWEQEKTDSKDRQKPYGNLFPSLYMSYKASESDELQLSGLRRISRPKGFRLNPNPNMSDSSNITFGNPDLLPEKMWSFEFNYVHTTPNAHVYTASLYYKFADDVVEQYSWMDGKAYKSTWANMNQSHSAGLELIAKNKFKYITFTTNVNLYYNSLVGGTEQATVLMDNGNVETFYFELKKRSGYTGNCKESIDFRLPADITGQFSANYRAPRIAAQGDVKGQFMMNFGLKKSFLDRKLNVSASIRDITNSRNRTLETQGNKFSQKSVTRRNSRTIALNVSYSFGTNQKGKNSKKKDGGVSFDDDIDFDD